MIKHIKQLRRLIYIYYVFFKFGLDRFIYQNPYCKPLKLISYCFPSRWFRQEMPPTGKALRQALEILGPIFVKFGQMLSTRQDLLPEEVALELSKLQDNVPPFPGEIAQQRVEQSLKKPLSSLFKSFDLLPLASASIAQAHQATCFNGQAVVVKILRPDIEKQIAQDVALLETLAQILNHIKAFKRFRPIDVVKEIKYTLHDEIDLLKEAANASQLRRHFISSDSLYVPIVYWDYCRKDVLVTEQIKGVRISDIDTLKRYQVNLKRLAERGVEIFFTQVFRDCFFHADMHPGNIFVDISIPSNPKYVAVDFGIMGHLNPSDQRYLAENFLAFFERDYRRVATLHIESGWVPKQTSISAFEAAIRTVCEPIFEKPLKDISFAQTLLRLFQVAHQFNMEVQPQLLLLQKTLVNIEGLGRQLYPELDLWSTAKPFLEKWMKNQYSPKRLLKEIRLKFPKWATEAIQMPDTLHEALQQWQSQLQPYLQKSMPSLHKRSWLTLRNISTISLGCTLILSATLITLYTLPPATLERWGTTSACVLAILGITLLRKKRANQ